MATRLNGAPKPVGLGKEKLALIHVARRDCRLTDDDYRTILQEAGGVTSAQALSEAGFRKVMERFKALGFVHRPKAGNGAAAAKDRFGRRAGMASPEQVATIEAMWSRWASADAGTAGLAHWLEKRFGVSSLRFATVQTAQMAIEGLKAMLARREPAKTSPDQAEGRPVSIATETRAAIVRPAKFVQSSKETPVSKVRRAGASEEQSNGK